MLIHRAVIFASALVEFVVATAGVDKTINYVVIAIGLMTVVVVGRGQQKNKTIADFKLALEGASARADAEHEARQVAEHDAASLRGKVEMLERYAAPQAFKAIDHTLGELRATIGESISSQGELILKNTELVSKAVSALERVAADLEALAERLHPETLDKVAEDLSRLAERLGAGGDTPAQPPN